MWWARQLESSVHTRAATRVRTAGALCGAALLTACHPAATPLRLGTTTTVEQSGALSLLTSLWQGPPLATVIGPSGQILRSAAAGDLDVVITHAPVLEAKWLGGGRAALVCPLVASQFAIVGPATDPAGVRRAAGGADALRRIAHARALFVSRGDSSGTHTKERALWARAGVNPGGEPWYVESGAGQAATLQIADERGGYALADLPTLAHMQGLSLRPLLTADTALTNPYTLYVVRRPRGGAEHSGARAFAAWAMGPWRDQLIALHLSDGTPAFVPRPGGCSPREPSLGPLQQPPRHSGERHFARAADDGGRARGLPRGPLGRRDEVFWPREVPECCGPGRASRTRQRHHEGGRVAGRIDSIDRTPDHTLTLTRVQPIAIAERIASRDIPSPGTLRSRPLRAAMGGSCS